MLGGTASLLAGAIIIAEPSLAIIAEPSLAIIAEPVPIVRLHPSHYITRPPPLMYGYVWVIGQVENYKVGKL